MKGLCFGALLMLLVFQGPALAQCGGGGGHHHGGGEDMGGCGDGQTDSSSSGDRDNRFFRTPRQMGGHQHGWYPPAYNQAPAPAGPSYPGTGGLYGTPGQYPAAPWYSSGHVHGAILPPAGGQAAYQPAYGSAASGPPFALAYKCPMHPEVISDRPGRCPKCGMDLVLANNPPGNAWSPAWPGPAGDAAGGAPPQTFGGGPVQTFGGAPVQTVDVVPVQTAGGAHVQTGSGAPPKKDAGAAVYQCPMHPEVTAAKPGRCPKCGMDLQKVQKKGSGR